MGKKTGAARPLRGARPESPTAIYWQVKPQIELTSLTHWLSQLFVQQKLSWAQTLVAHGSQVEVSLPPGAQIACAQVPPPPPQVFLQIEATSPTHLLSQLFVQQKLSVAQICVAHGS